MATQTPAETLPIGTLVRILNSSLPPGRIVEYRGPLGPKGARIYGVRLGKKPYSAYAEFREDQLEVISTGTGQRP